MLLLRKVSINIASNFAARLWLGILSLAIVPYTIRKLGVDAYAVLSLTTIVFGYMELLDFGLARGLTRFVAAYKVKDAHADLEGLLGTAAVLYLAAGIVAGVAVASSANLIVKHLFNIPADLVRPAQVVFYLMGFGLIARFPGLMLLAVLTGYQKLHLANVVNVVLTTLRLLAVVSVLTEGYGVRAVTVISVAATFIQSVVFYCVVRRMLPRGLGFGWHSGIAREIFRFSRNAFVTDVLAKILVNLDKFLIGLFLPVGKLAYYSVTFDLTSQLWQIPSNITSATLPAMTEAHTSEWLHDLEHLYTSTSKIITAGTAYCGFFLFFFAKPILTFWISADFAEHATLTMQVLAIAMILSSCCWAPLNLAYSVGRSEIPAKVHFAMAVLNLLLCIAWIPKYGLEGAALAWLVEHVMGFTVMTTWVHWVVFRTKPTLYFVTTFAKPILFNIFATCVSLWFLRAFATSLIRLGIIGAIGGVVAGVLHIALGFSEEERKRFRSLLQYGFSADKAGPALS